MREMHIKKKQKNNGTETGNG